jgi:hypothetical protein
MIMTTRHPRMWLYFGDAVLDAGFLTVPHLLIR